MSLATSTQAWVEEALSRPGVRSVDITPRIAIESASLPEPFHADPADRMLVATARLNGLTLLTADRRILDYAVTGHVRTKAVV